MGRKASGHTESVQEPEYVRDANGEKIKLPSGHYKSKKHNTTNWNNRNNVELWRKEWADSINKYLERAGHKEQVDHRSYERQGRNKIPTSRLSQEELELEKRGIPTPRGDMNRQIRADNQRWEELEREAAQLKANMQQKKKRKFRWKPSPQRKALQDFWREVREKDSHMMIALAQTWQRFKQEAQLFLYDIPHPSHHERHMQKERHPQKSHD